MSNYRDTVREMMRDLKANKASPATTAPVEAIEAEVPDEEHLLDVALDDILDFEEGVPVSEPIMNEEEADRLLASSPVPETEENNGKCTCHDFVGIFKIFQPFFCLRTRARICSSPLFMLCKQNVCGTLHASCIYCVSRKKCRIVKYKLKM